MWKPTGPETFSNSGSAGQNMRENSSHMWSCSIDLRPSYLLTRQGTPPHPWHTLFSEWLLKRKCHSVKHPAPVNTHHSVHLSRRCVYPQLRDVKYGDISSSLPPSTKLRTSAQLQNTEWEQMEDLHSPWGSGHSGLRCPSKLAFSTLL